MREFARRSGIAAASAAALACLLSLASLVAVPVEVANAYSGDSLGVAPLTAHVPAGGEVTLQGLDFDGSQWPWDVTAQTTFTVPAPAHCNGNRCGSTVAGTYVVTATWGSLTTTSTLIVDPGPAVRFTIAPAWQPGCVASWLPFVCSGTDRYGNATTCTAQATFSISPDGECSGPSCRFSQPGEHTIIGTFGSYSSSVEVMADAVHAELRATSDGTSGGDVGAVDAPGGPRRPGASGRPTTSRTAGEAKVARKGGAAIRAIRVRAY